MQTLSKPVVSDEQKRQYVEHGWFVLPAVMPKEHVEMLRGECQFFIDHINRKMDAMNTDVWGINHRNNRYFISNLYHLSKHMHEFIFSDLMAEICKATLGPNTVLFNEQWVVKYAEKGMKFAWHQDSGYVGFEHPAYLTCWCPLDDVDQRNGTVYVLPYDRAGTREIIKHKAEAGSNDLVGYFGDDPGIPVICPAGSVVCFSSRIFHRSGPNTTNAMRRVYLPQYAAAPIQKPDGSGPLNLAVPFLRDGKNIAAKDHYRPE